MPGRAETLFAQLHDVGSVLALIGQAEDAHLDCKEWPQGDESQKMLSKAACGLTNADGGVLVIGMKAESPRNDEADVIKAPCAVADTSLVKSRVLDLIGKLVEPGIVGLEVREIADGAGCCSGFVIVYVPKSESSPARSRKDWKFYQRVGSNTLPMDYWQIEAMFGRSARPKLSHYVRTEEMVDRWGYGNKPCRLLEIGLKNEGRGLAKFPGIRFKRLGGLTKDDFGIDGNCGFGLPPRPSESDWIVFRGGVDDVIYPGETRLIGKLVQAAVNKGEYGKIFPDQARVRSDEPQEYWVCEPIALEIDLYAEGIPPQTVIHPLDEKFLISKRRVR